MKPIAIYFIDLDGTFVDIGHNQVSKANYQAVKKAQVQGKKVVFATGRNMTASTMSILNRANVHDAIFLNGAIIMKNGHIIESKTINQRSIDALYEYFLVRQPAVILNSAINKKIHTGKMWMSPFFWLSRMKLVSVKKIATMYPVVHKYTIGAFKKKNIRKMFEEIKALNLDIEITTSYNDRVIEITPLNATKGIAIEKLLKSYKLDKSQAMHIGDSMNDATAKDYVDKLVAMADGSKSLINEANYLGPIHKKSGVAKIINNDDYTPINQNKNS